MNSFKLKRILPIVLILIASTSLCLAQQVQAVKKLSDGSYEITIDGQRLKAVTNEQLNQQAKAFDLLQARLTACQKDRAEADSQIATQNHEKELLKKDVTIAQMDRDSFKSDLERSRADTARAQEDAKRNYGLFIGERTLRQQASEFVPKGNAHGFWGKALDALNSQPAQIGFKLVIPTAQAAKVFFGRCTQ